MRTELVPYQEENTALEAFVAYPAAEEKCPVVLLCHAWRGRDDFICEKAKEIAKLGYIGFALDMYGKEVLGKTKEENAALKRPFIEDRALLQRRVLKGFEVACGLPQADQRAAVLGYGFGGVCALDLARSGADLKGAITVYGHFDPPPQELIKPMRAKVLVLHGYNDPIAPQEELRRFENEMNAAKVDWQAHIYGGVMHAFSTPGVNDPASGALYNSAAAGRAWRAVHDFLSEIFG